MSDDEVSRLNELAKYNILDTLTENDYDDITKLASVVCNAPIALISFVDKDRQWFKSHFGLNESQTPIEYSFCAHAIQEPGKPFVVENASADERFKDNPLVTGNPGIVFYAGIPIVSENGTALGTVCVIDTKIRDLNDAQLEGLKILSRQAMHLLDLRRINNELKHISAELSVENNKLGEHSSRLEKEMALNLARRIREIAEQNNELVRLNKEMEAFTYISSHDLQEPLRKIQVFTSMLAANSKIRNDEQINGILSKIDNASNRMRMLIRDLVSYTRYTVGPKNYQTLLLGDIINEVKQDLQEEIDSATAVIVVRNNIEIKIIPFQFRQLLYNVIGNSIKFRKPNIAPLIDISCKIEGMSKDEDTDREIRYYHITITDNGIGFNQLYSEKIFELFQGIEANVSRAGTGIGLAIAKKIAENHGGFIKATSDLGQGAMFSIYIPVHESDLI